MDAEARLPDSNDGGLPESSSHQPGAGWRGIGLRGSGDHQGAADVVQGARDGAPAALLPPSTARADGQQGVPAAAPEAAAGAACPEPPLHGIHGAVVNPQGVLESPEASGQLPDGSQPPSTIPSSMPADSQVSNENLQCMPCSSSPRPKSQLRG